MPWEARTNVNNIVYGVAYAPYNGKIYSTGGYLFFNRHEEYDTTLDTWTIKSNTNGEIRDHQAAVRAGVGHYILDGTTTTTDSNEIRTYTPATNLWNSINDSTVTTTAGRYGWLVTGANGNLYQGGGTSNTGIHRWNGTAWSSVTTISPATAWEHSKAVLAHDGHIYIHGGSNPAGSVFTNQMLRYTPDTTWATMTPAPNTRYGHAMVAANPWIYIVGGRGDAGYLDSVHRYDPALDTYTVMEALPYSNPFKIAAAVHDSYMYVWGGTDATVETDLMYRIKVGATALAATLSGTSAMYPYPLGASSISGEASFTASSDVAFSGGVEADSFIGIGDTGSPP